MSSPSTAFLESCLAKSEACHHSRNFRANIEVGRRIFRLESSRGYTICIIVRGLKMLDPWPGRAPGLDEDGEGWVARVMARWSASLRRRIRVEISQRRGEECFVLSKR